MFVASGAVIDAVVGEAINTRALDVTAVAVNLSGNINTTSILMSASATITDNGQGFVDEININNADEIGHNVSVRITSGAVSRGLIETIVPRGATLNYRPSVGWHVDGTAVGSGWITSGLLGFTSVLSGNIGSGQISTVHLKSGAISSGKIANGSVMSGTITPGQISDFKISSGAKIDSAELLVAEGLLTAEMISGRKCVTINTSGQLVIAMAGMSGRFPAIGIVVDNILSGQTARRYHKGRVYSPDNIFNFSGGIGTDYPLWLGISGDIVVSNQLPGGSGLPQVVGLATWQSGMLVDLYYNSSMSGRATRYSIGSGALEDGVFASGQIGGFPFGSGSVRSGFLADEVLSTYKIQSGTVITITRAAMADIGSGLIREIITEELISGGQPVNISQSGYARVAMAGVSGRIPAVGVLIENVDSGLPLFLISGTPLIYEGVVQCSSGILPISGFGQKLYVGMSGGFALELVSGMVCQYIGVNVDSGTMFVRVDQNITSGNTLSFLEV